MTQETLGNKTVLVIGGGNFGARACRFFKRQKARVILVDNDPGCEAKEFTIKDDFILRDAQTAWDLALKIKPDFIVPTQPGHTCGKWLREYFHLKPLSGSVSDVTKRIPQSMFLGCDELNARLIFSYMTRGKLCPEECHHLTNECALTREPRPVPLYKLLEYAVFGLFDCGKIFMSEQMAPGVGAIRTSEFLAFMTEVEAKKPKTLAVGTACLCHGVLNLFKQ